MWTKLIFIEGYLFQEELLPMEFLCVCVCFMMGCVVGAVNLILSWQDFICVQITFYVPLLDHIQGNDRINRALEYNYLRIRFILRILQFF